MAARSLVACPAFMRQLSWGWLGLDWKGRTREMDRMAGGRV